jgi:hypothetical protein
MNSIARLQRNRIAVALGLALVSLVTTAPGVSADMSLGRNTAAFDGTGAIPPHNVTTLATATLSKLRRHTVILVDATVSKIDPGVDTEVYLAIDGTLSGPITKCPPTNQECSLSFHRPIDADERNIGMPMTLSLLAYSPTGDTWVQVGFTAHAVKK